LRCAYSDNGVHKVSILADESKATRLKTRLNNESTAFADTAHD